MALVNLDLVGAYAISQGYEWRLNLYYPGNVINLAPWGQIWNAYEAGTGLAQFQFGQAAYNAAINRTILPIILNPFTTKNLSPTGAGFYVYEIKLSLPRQSPKPVLAGKVHVLPTIEFLR